jgi:uncharacterized protein YjbJ (UPF0337 family)
MARRGAPEVDRLPAGRAHPPLPAFRAGGVGAPLRVRGAPPVRHTHGSTCSWVPRFSITARNTLLSTAAPHRSARVCVVHCGARPRREQAGISPRRRWCGGLFTKRRGGGVGHLTLGGTTHDGLPGDQAQLRKEDQFGDARPPRQGEQVLPEFAEPVVEADTRLLQERDVTDLVAQSGACPGSGQQGAARPDGRDALRVGQQAIPVCRVRRNWCTLAGPSRRWLTRGSTDPEDLLPRAPDIVHPSFQAKGFPMNKDQVNGAANQAAGEAKKQVGKLTGDTSREIGGAAQQVKGKVQEKIGDAKESARDADEQTQREEDAR